MLHVYRKMIVEKTKSTANGNLPPPEKNLNGSISSLRLITSDEWRTELKVKSVLELISSTECASKADSKGIVM